MTAQEYIDDVKLRLLRLDVDIDLNDPFILTMINRARNDVQVATYSLFPERYAAIYKVSYTIADITAIKSDELSLASQSAYKDIEVSVITLPSNVIDIYNVMVSWQSTIRDVEWSTNCRKTTKEEMFSVQNHAWNVPTADDMICMIEKTNNINLLYVSDLSIASSDLASGTVDVDIWYISALSDMENINSIGNDDSETVLSPEVEEIVIYYAMLYCLEGVHQEVAYDYIKDELNILEKSLKENYSIQKKRVGSLLPSKEGVA